MTDPRIVSAAIAEQASWLLEQGRVRLLLHEDESPGAVVLGRTADYVVRFDQFGAYCECWPGLLDGDVRCSHVVASMIAWHESETEPCAR